MNQGNIHSKMPLTPIINNHKNTKLNLSDEIFFQSIDRATTPGETKKKLIIKRNNINFTTMQKVTSPIAYNISRINESL